MNNIREFIHKLPSVGKLGTTIDCDTGLAANGNVGVYLLDTIIGTDTGWVQLDYDAINVPDRFQIIYDGVIVADSKYVGDSLGTYIPQLLDSFNLPQKEYDGVQFINNGSTESFTNTSDDIADGSPSEPTSGSGSIGFIKNSATPSLLRIKSFGPVEGTAWNITINCPVAINDRITLSTTSNSSTWQADSLTKTGAAVTWYAENGVYDSIVGDTPTFNLSENLGLVDFTIFESTNITELYIDNQGVTTFNASNNPGLTDLDFRDNALTSFDTTNCTGLSTLNVAGNLLATLDVSTNTSLLDFRCNSNNLSALDVSTNTLLVTFECNNNNLTNLDITNNTALLNVKCEGNPLVSGDIDNILIQLDTNGLSNGTLDLPLGRTAASDAALTSLQGKGWVVTET